MRIAFGSTWALFLVSLGCSEVSPPPCPEIEDAVLLTSRYVGDGPYIVGAGGLFPHASGSDPSFIAWPDTTTGTLTLKYRRGEVEVVEVWDLQKLR